MKFVHRLKGKVLISTTQSHKSDTIRINATRKNIATLNLFRTTIVQSDSFKWITKRRIPLLQYTAT